MDIQQEAADSDDMEDNDGVAYIDRLVDELDDNQEEAADGDYSGGENEAEAMSHDEFEYDSDEDIAFKIIPGKYGYDTQEWKASHGKLSEQTKSVLLWRLDENESFSDWSIEVSYPKRGRKTTKMYHVHRSALAAGPSKSGYFEALFKSEQFKECKDSTSQVELPSEEVAASFPAFLDFMYCPPAERQSVINRDNVLPLKALAEYFLVPLLEEVIINFIEEDMHDVDGMQIYLSACCGADDDYSRSVLARATRVCAEIILSIKTDSPLISDLPPAMFLQVMTLLRSTQGIKALQSWEQNCICELAIAYLRAHKHGLDSRFFFCLAKEIYLPSNTSQAAHIAISLLEMMKDTGWADESGWGITDMCVAVLLKHLSENGPHQVAQIQDIRKKVPIDVVDVLLAGAFNSMTTSKQAKKVWCDVKRGSDKSTAQGGTRRILLQFKATDSISYIKYLASRELNSSVYEVQVVFRGSVLCGTKTVSKCGITANSELTVVLGKRDVPRPFRRTRIELLSESEVSESEISESEISESDIPLVHF